MAESLVLSTGVTDLTLTDDANGITVVSHEYPAPAPRPTWASGVDVEGSRFLETQYENREISLTLETTTEAKLVELQAIVAQVGREGGTLTWTTPGGSVAIFDLLTWAGYESAFGIEFSVADTSRITARFPARPFARGAEVALDDHAETTLPVLVFTEGDIAGDVPALGRLVVDDDEGEAQAWVIWGLQSRHYSADASAALFFEAQDLTTLGSSTTTSGATGAYSSSVLRNSDLLGTTYLALLEGEIDATSDVFSHVGDFRVFARCYTPTSNSGDLSVALEWGQGDELSLTRNATVTYSASWEGSWRLIDLGSVSLREALSGSQRWTCRIVAQGSGVNGEEIDVDWLMVVPVVEGSGEAVGVLSQGAPSSYPARDVFDQSAGALGGKTATAGGTWATAGASTDFQVSGSGTVTRAATSDTSFRVGALGATDYAASTAFVDATATTRGEFGVVLRYVDSSNYLVAHARTSLYVPDGIDHLTVTKVVGGTSTQLAATSSGQVLDVGTFYRVTLTVSASGTWEAVIGVPGQAAIFSLSGADPVLATGGTLASGKPGIADRNVTVSSTLHTYDNFYFWEPVTDAAVFASQSLQVRHDGVIRENAAGTVWSPVSKYEGDHLLVPPAGPDGRTTRIIVKASRGVPGTGIDAAADDISAKLHVTPRYLVVPS